MYSDINKISRNRYEIREKDNGSKVNSQKRYRVYSDASKTEANS